MLITEVTGMDFYVRRYVGEERREPETAVNTVFADALREVRSRLIRESSAPRRGETGEEERKANKKHGGGAVG